MIKGISQLLSREGTPEGFAFYAKNMQSTQLDESHTERGTARIDSFPSTGTIIVGEITFSHYIIVFYIQEGLDKIGVYDEDNGSFTVKLTRSDLDFNLTHPISGKAKFNFKQQLIVTFTDRATPPKYINLDTATGADLLESYSLSFFAPQPNVRPEPVDNSGVFRTGAYLIATQYVDKNQMSTQWSTLSGPVYITVDSLRATYTSTFGSPPNVITGKGIKLNITGLNTKYAKLRIAVISKINDVISASIYKEMNIQTANMVTVLTGTELSETIGIEEILTPSQYFSSVDNIESLSDQLFVGGFTIPNIDDYSNYTNQLDLKWTSTPKYGIFQAVTDIRLDQSDQKTFGHDEVYAFYVRYELPNGTITQWFHKPGRVFPSSPDMRAVSSLNSGAGNINTSEGGIKRFQLEDTCSVVQTVGDLGNTGNPGFVIGDFGYWENANETYPTGHPYAGENVRHWRFPSTRWLADNVYNFTIGSTQSHSYLTDTWDVLGVRVIVPDPSPSTPPFTRIQLGYARRDEANSTVLGYDIIQFAGSPVTSPNVESSSGGNWNIEAPGASPENNFNIPNKQSLRFHSPDVFMIRPNVSDIYLSYIKKMRLNNIGALDYQHGLYGRISSGRDGDEQDVWSFVTNYRFSNTSSVIPAASSYKKLTGTMYVPNNTATSIGTTTINNLLNEEYLRGVVNQDANVEIADDPTTEYKVNVGGNTFNTTMFEETNLLCLKIPRSDMYLAYTDQIIVPCGNFFIDTERDFIGFGDTFIAVYSFLAMCSAPGLDGPFNFESGDGCRNFKMFLCESRFNLTQRTITFGDPNTYHLFNPRLSKTGDRTIGWIYKLDQNNYPGNQVIYSKDFNTLNIYETYGIFDHNIDYRSEYPYAIARSVKASRANSVDDGWRTFLPNDVFYTANDKGRITNLQALGTDNLLIHHEQALFKTRDKAVLQSDIAKISLGSGDLFSLDPEELIGTNYGFGGTQHKYSCILCEFGYFFVDIDTGELLLYKEGKAYMNIGKGYYWFFKDTLGGLNIKDNPLNETGITVGFDKRNSRLILSLKASSPYTFYYDFIKEEWYSACDALPDLIFGSRKNLYSFKNGEMHIHGYGPRGTYYGTNYPAFVDIIINEEPNITKVLEAIQWITRVNTDDGRIFMDDTFTSITIWNDTFCTGKIDIKKYENLIDYEETNTTKNEDGTWSFNAIKDAVIDLNIPFISNYTTDYRPINSNLTSGRAWFESAPLRGKYFIVRLEYSNLENKELSLKAVKGNLIASHS